MDLSGLENELRGRSYKELHERLRLTDSSTLLLLLDNGSVRVGDTAAGLLQMRREADLVIKGLIDSTIRLRIGKIRALHILKCFGKDCAGAFEAYLRMMSDRSFDVASSALFGLAFMQDERALPHLKRRLAEFSEASRISERIAHAIEAIEKKDPFIYCPYFGDHANVWMTKK